MKWYTKNLPCVEWDPAPTTEDNLLTRNVRRGHRDTLESDVRNERVKMSGCSGWCLVRPGTETGEAQRTDD